jgi:uncharacterized lipoprotein
MKICNIVLALTLTAGLAACASWMPDDPYLEANSVKALEVPEGAATPTADPSLIVPEGEIGEIVQGGHKPPSE